MTIMLEWDDNKRLANLGKHQLDFIDAVLVLGSAYRLDVDRQSKGELRILSFAYVFDVLAVLTVVHTARGDIQRVISFRPASDEERQTYHEWLEHDFNGI